MQMTYSWGVPSTFPFLSPRPPRTRPPKLPHTPPTSARSHGCAPPLSAHALWPLAAAAVAETSLGEHKVIIVGLDNAGKTTILYQFSMNEVVHTSPTIGSNVEEIVVNNTRFLMWDIGGQESLRSSWNTYYTNTEFVIVVVDSTDRERISVTREELYKMLAHEQHSAISYYPVGTRKDVFLYCLLLLDVNREIEPFPQKDKKR
ncbi:ADP-ribosylation factor-like protein 5A isoform X2 [Petaurus breviceps papuanus]|uniref:ADP-ribosylation factor-like protein 5A isoform X2 n=1 Tax=Petaurus breviceps papuanus TaxID=3040969 RepID=UPI0036DA46CB